MDSPVPNMAARLIILVLGMCFVAFGIALSRQTLLGSSPISTVPTVLSFAFPISIGTFTFFMNLIFLLGQIVVLRKDFSPVQLLQLPFLVFFSAAIDMFVGIVASWPFDTYALRLVWIIVSSFAVALGVYLQSQMRLVMTPGDALVVSIAAVTKKGFSTCKFGFDMSQILLGLVFSLVFSGGLVGIREGTLISAALVGPIIRAYFRLFGNLDRFIPIEGHPTFLPEAK